MAEELRLAGITSTKFPLVSVVVEDSPLPEARVIVAFGIGAWSASLFITPLIWVVWARPESENKKWKHSSKLPEAISLTRFISV